MWFGTLNMILYKKNISRWQPLMQEVLPIVNKIWTSHDTLVPDSSMKNHSIHLFNKSYLLNIQIFSGSGYTSPKVSTTTVSIT